MSGPTGLRLIFYCAMLAGVIWAMGYAGRAENWNWFFELGEAGEAPKEDSSDPTAGRLPGTGTATFHDPPDSNPEPDSPSEEPGELLQDGQPAVDESSPESGDLSGDRREQGFWRRTIDKLKPSEQQALLSLIDHSVQQEDLPTGTTATASRLLKKIDKWRQQHLQLLTESGGNAEASRRLWENSWRPAFRAVVVNDTNPELITNELRQLPGIVRKAAWSLIEDKSPLGRSEETYAWFSAWSTIFDQPIETTAGQTATVAQLLAQPDPWRGQPIDVKGTALRFQKVNASLNPMGIKHYYVLWIKPDYASIYPICVYSMMVPELFLDGESEPTGSKLRQVKQRVEVTGYFFKNCFFASDGASYAPVLLTTSVKSPASGDAGGATTPAVPSGRQMFLTIALIGGFAVLLAWTVFRTTSKRGTRREPDQSDLQQEWTNLKQDERVVTTSEKLKRMSEMADADHAENDNQPTRDDHEVG